MKASLFTHNGQMEIQFDNGVSFQPHEQETLSELTKRAIQSSKDGIELREYGIKELRRRSSSTLLKQSETATGLEEIMIREILLSRKIEIPTVVQIDTEDEGDITPEIKEPEIKEPEIKEPEIKEKKPAKSLKKQLTLEEAQELVEIHSANKGKIITFTNKKGETITSPINGIRHDKRSGVIFYMTKTETGIFGKAIWSEDYTITDPE